ncbi:unnamed protein product [Rotaria magnacalcarata]|uniref:Nudix hydrolase domain-containing protein n=1 Tax=Rotaria magnacalcarata TaxID=392030 RepID=A0A816TJM1_9BILA|nr:unnamed protein product [Rotaria magnacalcarata]CAF3925432.1 unnamed protein product [Rotaria magnacalcarata]
MVSTDLNKYRGSGVLIVDMKRSSVLLVYDYTKNYNCCGGNMKYNYDDPRCIEKTARDELYEETRTLISCDIDQIMTCPFVDLDHKNSIFRCYIFKTECPSDICQQFDNVKLDENTMDADYYETTAVAFFPLNQFKHQKSLLSIDKNCEAKQIDGTLSPLNQRVISVIKAAIKENLF